MADKCKSIWIKVSANCYLCKYKYKTVKYVECCVLCELCLFHVKWRGIVWCHLLQFSHHETIMIIIMTIVAGGASYKSPVLSKTDVNQVMVTSIPIRHTYESPFSILLFKSIITKQPEETSLSFPSVHYVNSFTQTKEETINFNQTSTQVHLKNYTNKQAQILMNTNFWQETQAVFKLLKPFPIHSTLSSHIMGSRKDKK